MLLPKFFVRAAILASAASTALALQGQSVPSVVVTVENVQPGRGVFLTPPWLAIHDGTFDTYDEGSVASVPLGGNEIEALAEDGNAMPLSLAFANAQPGAPQVVALPGPTGPLGPGGRAGLTLQVDPTKDRYFSYASMVIPSNDTFVANGDPMAHALFDAAGTFVGEDFLVSGDETNDAGTELDDELAVHVAFLAQAGPNIGVTTNLPVVSPAPGFAPPGSLAYPNGVLNHPAFVNGDFNDSDDRLLLVRFQYVDLGSRVQYEAVLTPGQEIQADLVHSDAGGSALLASVDGARLGVHVTASNLSGPIVAAHLHLAPAGAVGPVVVDLTSGLLPAAGGVRFLVQASDLTGPLAGASFIAFLNQVAAGNVYVNLHTAQYPGGELRGQVSLAP